jgi:hypothetical protein
MSGYKPGYSEANSPNWQLGYEDGKSDRARLAQDPPLDPIGPNPPQPAYPMMYNRGYEAGFQGL